MSHAEKKAKHAQRDQRAAERVDPAKRAQRIAEDHPRWPLSSPGWSWSSARQYVIAEYTDEEDDHAGPAYEVDISGNGICVKIEGRYAEIPFAVIAVLQARAASEGK